MQDSYQTVGGTLRITRLITVTVTLSSTNSPIKGAESHRTKPCGYIVMMTTSPRHICLSVLAVSANPQTVMRDTHTKARSHTHTHTPLSFPLFLLFSQFDSHVVATGEQQLLRVPAHTAHHHHPHVGESHVGMLTQQYCTRRAHHWQPPLRESDIMMGGGRAEDVQEIMGRERRKEVKACAALGGSVNSLLITYVIGSSEMLAPHKVWKHQM